MRETKTVSILFQYKIGYNHPQLPTIFGADSGKFNLFVNLVVNVDIFQFIPGVNN